MLSQISPTPQLPIPESNTVNNIVKDFCTVPSPLSGRMIRVETSEPSIELVRSV
jgi:hypothetical protein